MKTIHLVKVDWSEQRRREYKRALTYADSPFIARPLCAAPMADRIAATLVVAPYDHPAICKECLKQYRPPSGFTAFVSGFAL